MTWLRHRRGGLIRAPGGLRGRRRPPRDPFLLSGHRLRARRHAHSAQSRQMKTAGVAPSSARRRPDLPQHPHEGMELVLPPALVTAGSCRTRRRPARLVRRPRRRDRRGRRPRPPAAPAPHQGPRRPLFVFGPYAVRGAVDLVLAFVTTVPLAAGALVFYGLSTSTGNVTFSSLVQSRVPEDFRGRAFAGFDVLWQTGRMLSLLGGLLLIAAAAVGAAGARLAARPR